MNHYSMKSMMTCEVIDVDHTFYEFLAQETFRSKCRLNMQYHVMVQIEFLYLRSDEFGKFNTYDCCYHGLILSGNVTFSRKVLGSWMWDLLGSGGMFSTVFSS